VVVGLIFALTTNTSSIFTPTHASSLGIVPLTMAINAFIHQLVGSTSLDTSSLMSQFTHSPPIHPSLKFPPHLPTPLIFPHSQTLLTQSEYLLHPVMHQKRLPLHLSTHHPHLLLTHQPLLTLVLFLTFCRFMFPPQPLHLPCLNQDVQCKLNPKTTYSSLSLCRMVSFVTRFQKHSLPLPALTGSNPPATPKRPSTPLGMMQ
jgi:hypothetical protein